MSKWTRLMILAAGMALVSGCWADEPSRVLTEPTMVETDAGVTPIPELEEEPEPTSTPEPELVVGDPWWNDAVFYQVFVRSFYDTTGDGKGDIRGLIEKLDYLNDGDPNTTDDLGITGIWLMPIKESPSYHGYDVVDYYSIERDYGTMEDFKELLEEAHKRGIRVIIDFVINHTSSQHPWFLASKQGDEVYRDYYIWEDENPGFRGPWSQVVWIPYQGDYYYAVFWDQMPDLNLENPAVTEEIYAITEYWLNEVGVDGFRLDAIRHFIEDGAAQENTPATHAWLRDYHRYYKSVNPDAITVGEAWTMTPLVVNYVGDQVDIAFEFDLAEAFVASALGPLAIPAMSQMQLVLDSYPVGQYGVFLTNHDQNRVASVVNDDVRTKLAGVMMLTAPGVPFIYYGEEIGMLGRKPDEDIRRPMAWTGTDPRSGFTTGIPWRTPALEYQQRNVALLDQDPDSILNMYRVLIHLRNDHSALRTGGAVLPDPGSARLFSMLRYDDEGAFLILVNVHPREVTSETYGLSLPEGPLWAGGQAEVVFQMGFDDIQTANPPVVNAAGGFDEYVPLPEIPGESAVIIRLTP